MTKRLSTGVVEFARIWGVLTAVVVVGLVATYQYVGAPPPRVIRMATGAENGAYHAFAQQYARLLARDGIVLEVVPTAGSVENLALLRNGDVTLALVQGGSATSEDREHLQSLGSLFLEPVWVFTRADAAIQRLSALNGTRVAVGAIGSGTHLLATQLLAASGVTEANATLIDHDASEVRHVLSHGDVDAAFLVASPQAPVIQDLVQQPAIALFDVERAAAYSRVFPFLTPVVLSEGVLDLERNAPPRDTTLLAVAAMLAARQDLNASLIPALLDTVTRVHQPGGVLEQRRQFPSVDYVDLPLNNDAGRYIREGPSFLYRWLPYGTAVLLDRLKLLVLPLLALLIPLFRVAPPLYQWRIRSKIYRWYAAVREIDSMAQNETMTGSTESVATRLRALEREVASISVPLAYTGELYNLRRHIRLLQEKLDARPARSAGHAEKAP
jgi:TRAP transporter TAXI family solute receptor